jgi:predicted TIM-barrel fold metal-dependent hydrolase
VDNAALQLLDVHHHFVPPFYLAENRDRIAQSRGGQLSAAWLEWTPRRTLDAMDRNNVAAAVLSMSTPGVWFGNGTVAHETARRSNEYAADLVRSYPSRFGFFAAIALPDTDGALREIEYAFDVLGADGIALLTCYDGKWLGHADYMPVFAELHRRGSVVFVHPTTPASTRTLMPDVSPMIAEVPQDTARAIINLLLTGTLSRFPGIRFIFSHAGGTFPMIAGRLQQYVPKPVLESLPEGIEHELHRLYYDIAGTAHPPAVAALRNLVPDSQILFGSDEPHVALSETAQGMDRLGLPSDVRAAIGRCNATRILPRLTSIKNMPVPART